MKDSLRALKKKEKISCEELRRTNNNNNENQWQFIYIRSEWIFGFDMCMLCAPCVEHTYIDQITFFRFLATLIVFLILFFFFFLTSSKRWRCSSLCFEVVFLSFCAHLYIFPHFFSLFFFICFIHYRSMRHL